MTEPIVKQDHFRVFQGWQRCCQKHVDLMQRQPHFRISPLVEVKREHFMDARFAALQLRPHQIQVVIYHSPCPDGFLAATILLSALPASVIYIGTDHRSLTRVLYHYRDYYCLLVDIAPTVSDLALLQPERFVVLDHHESSRETFAQLTPAQGIYEPKRSGCGLAWQYVYAKWCMPYLVAAVEARD